MKEGCQTCKHNRKRTIREKTCLKGYRAVFGYGCKEYQRRTKMREEWECPIDCKDRKIGCQNPNTCEVYKKRVERSEMLRSIKKVKPYRNIPRTTPTRKGERKKFKSW